MHFAKFGEYGSGGAWFWSKWASKQAANDQNICCLTSANRVLSWFYLNEAICQNYQVCTFVQNGDMMVL
jgi:hypothetical protein